MSSRTAALAALLALAFAASVRAELPRFGNSKLLLTGGVSSIDGAAGGGLTPWALIASYAAQGEIGATAFATRVNTQDYTLTAYGVAVGVHDRVEFSLAHQDLDAGDNLAQFGLAGLHLKQDIVGAKLRVAGEAVLDSDSWMPQISIGVLHKRARPGEFGPVLTGPLGAKERGTEVYLSATKLFLAPGILVNGTLRATRANQNGLLGFGGAQADPTRLHPELSVAWLPRKDLAIGAEVRAKPDNLDDSVFGPGALKEDDWFDVFVAWAPNKHISLTLAYVDLGHIAPAVQPRRQTGTYLSVQLAF